MTTDIYSAKQLSEVRKLLLEEQGLKDALTFLTLSEDKAVCDHKHDTECFVRGVLHRSCNSALGRIENTFKRDLSWWYPYNISEFLRQAATYLEKDVDKRYRHNSFIKELKTKFNKLSAKQMDEVLVELGSTPGKNLAERKSKFAKIVLDRSLGYDTIKKCIDKRKEPT